MKKIKVLFFTVIFITPFLGISQITVKPQNSTNVNLIGKISHTGAMQTNGLSRKLPTIDALTLVGDEDINLYKQLREEANNTYSSVGVRKMALIDEEFAASILYFKDRDKFLLTFKNISYNFQNESFWMSTQTKLELHQFIRGELIKKTKYKNIEVILDNNAVLVLSINKKKVSFNFYDGYSWVNSSWFRLFKIDNLFGVNP
jgi:hypothetical protein